MEHKFHIPVMLKESLGYLNLGPGKTIVDATLGTGGHSEEIVKHILPGGRLIGIDRDRESLDVARDRLRQYADSCQFVYGNFSDIDIILEKLNITKIDGVLFDLGVSSFQLEDANRGFSFYNDGPLDMRLDRESYISAYDLVNNRIAHLLVEERQRHPIATTSQLANIVMRAMPPRYRYRHYRIHPATRTFQAMRIAVNRELETLEIAINKAIDLLNKKGRICVISFHSLEDRIVKLNFRSSSLGGRIGIITPKPLTTSAQEREANHSSRSAKLRVAQKN